MSDPRRKTANFNPFNTKIIDMLAEQNGVTFSEMANHLAKLGMDVFMKLPAKTESGDVALISYNQEEIEMWKHPKSSWGGKRK